MKYYLEKIIANLRWSFAGIYARNTVDFLRTIRELKEGQIRIVFEEENIDTMDNTGELLITILSSQAQEESRNLSENTR